MSYDAKTGVMEASPGLPPLLKTNDFLCNVGPFLPLFLIAIVTSEAHEARP